MSTPETIIDVEYETIPRIDDPPHYAELDPEPWSVIYDWFGVAGCLSHVIKYVARAGRKPDNPAVCDLKKARNWLDFLISRLEE